MQIKRLHDFATGQCVDCTITPHEDPGYSVIQVKYKITNEYRDGIKADLQKDKQKWVDLNKDALVSLVDSDLGKISS